MGTSWKMPEGVKAFKDKAATSALVARMLGPLGDGDGGSAADLWKKSAVNWFGTVRVRIIGAFTCTANTRQPEIERESLALCKKPWDTFTLGQLDTVIMCARYVCEVSRY
jgi:hypothetical protein